MSARAESVLPEQESGSLPIGIIIAGLVLAGVGLIGVVNLFAQGHAAFNVGSDGVVWGLPIVAYLFLALSSTGLAMVASLALVFGMKDFYPIAKRSLWLAIGLLIGAFVTLAFELGHPFRMLWAMPLNMQVSSPMFWMGVWYTVALVFMVLKIYSLQRGDWTSQRSRSIGVITLAAEIAAAGTLGLVFGMMAMRPFWYGSFVPLYFLATAALSGIAFATLFTYIAHGLDTPRMGAQLKGLMERHLPNTFALVLGVVLVFHVGRVITGLWSNNPEISLVMWHQAGTWMFHVELWLGMALPLLLLLTPSLRSRPGVQLISAVLVLVAMFISRYLYVTGGQIVPLWKGTWLQDFVAYTPSFTEWSLVFLGAGVGLLIYAYGSWKLSLNAQPKGT
jgi:Ni/Fe-hydrogenase subunit HybB-like protein